MEQNKKLNNYKLLKISYQLIIGHDHEIINIILLKNLFFAMLKSVKLLITILLVILTFSLTACVTPISGLKSYVSAEKGYEFLYPNGWIPMELDKNNQKVDLIFRDLIQRTENLSVIVSKIPDNQTLKDLGTPTDVGYRFFKELNNDPNSDREVELINAQSREFKGNTYYLLEYEVELADNQKRHDLASVAISRGKLFTFNLSTTAQRWDKVKEQFQLIASSFSVR